MAVRICQYATSARRMSLYLCAAVYPAGLVQNCSAGFGISVAKSWPSQSAPSDVNLFDLLYTVAGTTTPGTRVVSCQVAGYRAIPPLSRPGVSVYDATPVINSINPSTIPTGQSTTVTINGSNFGNTPGTIDICAWTNWPSPFSASTCTSSPPWTVGTISLWGALINVVLTPPLGASGHYCVQVTRLGANGTPFAGLAATSNCQGDIEATPCGTPTVSISPRPITLDDPNGKAPYYATLMAQGAPNGMYYTWSTNNSAMIEFDDPHASTVRLTIKRSGQATISVDAQNLCGNHASDSFTFVVSDDITVISWIDGQPIHLPGEASATVAGWMTDPIQCHLATLTWAAAGALQSPIAPPYDVGAATDIMYINAFMYKNSADPPPPQSLTDSERDRIHSNKSLYRGFSRFQAYYEVDPAFNNALASTFGVLKHDADVGATPDFCLGGYLAQEGEANIRNKTGGIRPDYAWWLNEFRVGTLGQNANAYLNKRGQDPYTAMPWVWALIQLDKNGKVVPLIQGTQGTAQIFPTYWVYSFDVLTQTVSQLGIQSLIALDGTSSYHE